MKPIFWIVFSTGTEYRKFKTRSSACLYAATMVALGKPVTIKKWKF